MAYEPRIPNFCIVLGIVDLYKSEENPMLTYALFFQTYDMIDRYFI